jgi:general secretion pathway protein A
MLSNITVDGKASVQTILLGQPQFRPILASQDWEQLRQRVLASYHLGPLSEAETRGYILHRLRTVGWRDDPAWEEAAFAAVHLHTGGIPRRINTLCSRVLLFGALEERHAITGAMVDDTAEELNRDLGAGLEKPAPMGADRDEVARRIEALERRALRQEQVLSRVMELLESTAAGRG